MTRARSHHPALGTVVRCGWGGLHRKGEPIRCTCSFYSASDVEVIAEQLVVAGWTKRRVRVPKAHRNELGARVTQYLCPEHTRHVATLAQVRTATRAATAAARAGDPERPSA
jgi:hypothetical protein